VATVFFNTLSRKKEEFVPLVPGKVGLYTCGPTVHDYAHIGNFRTYTFEDLLRRYLQWRGYEVTQVMNVTDVDDKTIRKSREQGVTLGEYTKKYTDAFFEDIDTLRIQRAHVYPRATEHVGLMVELIEKLEEKGHTYVSEGDVYYSIATFPGYGKLSGFDISRVKPGARVAVDEYEKEDARDFALWKGHREGEPSWPSPWGDGRPGWHIECSAMSMKYLGETFDIHTGGVDNMFPHHENEIAQSEGATGKPFARYFLHSEHLILGEGEKMSKSLGNFYTVRDLTEKGYDPTAIRYLLLSTHYRRQLPFTVELLDSAAESVRRLQDFYRRVKEYDADGPDDLAGNIEEAVQAFGSALDDDLSIAEALAAVFDLVRDGNRAMDESALSKTGRSKLQGALENINSVLDVMNPVKAELDAEVEALIAEREKAREAKDFARADDIRDELAAMGIELEDTATGTRWRRK
jgi:cysteinyl-tRNA synthetase